MHLDILRLFFAIEIYDIVYINSRYVLNLTTIINVLRRDRIWRLIISNCGSYPNLGGYTTYPFMYMYQYTNSNILESIENTQKCKLSRLHSYKTSKSTSKFIKLSDRKRNLAERAFSYFSDVITMGICFLKPDGKFQCSLFFFTKVEAILFIVYV